MRRRSAGSAGSTARSASRTSFGRRASSVGRRRDARFLVIGGPDAFMPEYEQRAPRSRRRLRAWTRSVSFLGDRADVPRLLSALDVFVWLSRAEGMPHVIAEAGAAGLPVVATRDNGTEQQLATASPACTYRTRIHRRSPRRSGACSTDREPAPTARRRRFGGRSSDEYSVDAVVPQWERLFEEVLVEAGR